MHEPSLAYRQSLYITAALLQAGCPIRGAPPAAARQLHLLTHGLALTPLLLTSLPPTRRYLALPEAVASFAAHMTTQLNLLTEAACLRRLAHNFADSTAVVFPAVFDASPDSALRYQFYPHHQRPALRKGYLTNLLPLVAAGATDIEDWQYGSAMLSVCSVCLSLYTSVHRCSTNAPVPLRSVLRVLHQEA